MLAHLPISSYDEFVHEPMRPTLISLGQLFFLAASPNLEIGWAKSGVKGPLTWGSKVDKSNSINWKMNQYKFYCAIYSSGIFKNDKFFTSS